MMEMQQLMMDDDAFASNDLCSNKYYASASSPSRSLSKVRFLRVLVYLNGGSKIHPRAVKLFDEAEEVLHGMGSRYVRESLSRTDGR
jgi:hypothetical protein